MFGGGKIQMKKTAVPSTIRRRIEVKVIRMILATKYSGPELS
jgi:hypothetical protein